MKTNLFSFLGLSLMPLLMISCTSTSTSKLISIEDYTFARSGEGDQLIVVDDPAIFKRGDAVHLILQDVGPFKKDEAGLNWFDLDMEIVGPNGEVIFSQTGLLGEAGHLALENNTAESPYATFTTTPELDAGSYKFRLMIYDRIGSGKATQVATFTLE